ncbi:MAG: phytase [Hyphomonadaceae bacterium]
MKRAALLGVTMLLGACASDNVVATVVPAFRETVGMGANGDAADDPAIWVHPTDASKSLILGTNKDAGVYVYGLDGSEKQKLLVGLSNNIDLRGNLAVASNDGLNVLSWIRIDPVTAVVSHAGDSKLETIEPYGVCIGVLDNALHAVVTYKTGLVEIWRVGDTGSGPVQISQKRTIKLNSQIEGCVIDDDTGLMFVGEENVGLWSVNLLSEDMIPKQIDKVNSGTGLVADVEGVTLYRGANGEGYLVVSAQGADRYVIYDRKPPHAALGVIKIGPSADGRVDGTSVTDGLDASSAAFPEFPAGILVVQDDANPVAEVDQNFKIVDWREIEKALAAAKTAPAS